ncbi:hypothetical protein ACJX0J_010138, partial [Zea mays]
QRSNGYFEPTVDCNAFNARQRAEKQSTRGEVVELLLHCHHPIRILKCFLYLVWLNRGNKRVMFTKMSNTRSSGYPLINAPSCGDSSQTGLRKEKQEHRDSGMHFNSSDSPIFINEQIHKNAQATTVLLASLCRDEYNKIDKINELIDALNEKNILLEKQEDLLYEEHDKDHPVDQILGDISKGVTTRSRLVNFCEHYSFSRRWKVMKYRSRSRPPSSSSLSCSSWEDATAIDKVIPEAALPAFSLETTRDIIRQHIAMTFLHLRSEISDALVRTHSTSNEKLEESQLQTAMGASKIKVSQGCIDLLQFLVKLRDLVIDWVQEGFQDFFQKLDGHFHVLSGRSKKNPQESTTLDSVQIDKVPTILVLMLAQLSVYIEHTTVPKVTEELASSFFGGGARSYEYGPPFVPGEICRLYRSSGEKFLHHYINMKTQKISKLLNKRFTTPVWIKHKEPREVNMFVDLLLLEINGVVSEVKQILPGLVRQHRHSDSTGSTTSSRSNPMREEMLNRSNTHQARSQFLENHLAKLFEQKMEIFTKVEYTQESVISTVLKLCLKSLQEFVRLQTFNRSGFQQIQNKRGLKEFVDDEAAISFLLKE